jgi:hypothetical protein
VAEDFEEAHYREVFHVGEEVAAFGKEPVPAEAEHLEVSRLLAEVVDEVRRVEVPGGLAAGHEQRCSFHVGQRGSSI